MVKSTRSDKSILYAIILIIILAVVFWGAFRGVNMISESSCADTLGETADNLAMRVSNSLQCDLEEMEVIADMLSAHSSVDVPDFAAHLNSFRQRRSICSLAVLLPGGEMFYSERPDFVLESTPDFESEKKLAPYVSERCGGEKKYIYYAQPLFFSDDNNVGGILYGFVDLESFPSLFSTTTYDGQCQEYIIDGRNGDFLMDTWHEELGNMIALGERETKSGYDAHDMKSDVTNGIGGYVVFRSKTTGEFFHSAYRPIGTGRFSVMVTVPESAVFENVNQIKQIFLIVAAADLVALATYFFVLLSGVRRRERKSEMQLAKTVYMYDIQKILFEAYKDSGLLIRALKKTAEAASAEGAILVSFNPSSAGDVYVWHPERSKLSDLFSAEDFKLEKEIIDKLRRGETVTLDGGSIEDVHAKGIKSTLLTPVLDNDAELVGILGIANPRYENEENAELLEGVSRDFMMALHDMESHKLIVRMGTIDSVTGLKNRASYQNALKEFALINEGIVCCVYIDANGLHDLNNSLGHAAGDAMLRYVAAKLKSTFGEDTFRIGGDEFTAFLFDVASETIEEMIRTLTESIEQRGYSVSAGYSLMEAPVRTDRLVSAAEQEMYAAKHSYYSQKKNAEKAREMNKKLEKILLEKKDSDHFLKIISSYFLGVYVVDLATDQTRVIYVPDYFREMLRRTDYKFSEALRLYANEYVAAEDNEKFLKLFDYSKIERAFGSGVPEIVYGKSNGDTINVRVFRSEDYSSEKKETFWLFEMHNST